LRRVLKSGEWARARSALLVTDLFAEFLTLVSFIVLCRPNFFRRVGRLETRFDAGHSSRTARIF
jgi:hypothetical protein